MESPPRYLYRFEFTWAPEGQWSSASHLGVRVGFDVQAYDLVQPSPRTFLPAGSARTSPRTLYSTASALSSRKVLIVGVALGMVMDTG